MLTNRFINHHRADQKIDCSFGNRLFRIAGIIGIATKNGYPFGFPAWNNQEYFVHPLPVFTGNLPDRRIRPNFRGIDFGFCGFDYPDNISLEGEFGSHKYFEHCEPLVRYYLEMKPIVAPVKDRILIHYRNYQDNVRSFYRPMDADYYKKAIKKLPSRPLLVVTDNIDVAYKSTGLNCDYTSNTPIEDFYLLSHADYLVMSNSTFSWWGAVLSGAMTVAPSPWFVGEYTDAPIDLYLPDWILI